MIRANISPKRRAIMGNPQTVTGHKAISGRFESDHIHWPNMIVANIETSRPIFSNIPGNLRPCVSSRPMRVITPFSPPIATPTCRGPTIRSQDHRVHLVELDRRAVEPHSRSTLAFQLQNLPRKERHQCLTSARPHLHRQ